jgi:hypothetical protein
MVNTMHVDITPDSTSVSCSSSSSSTQQQNTGAAVSEHSSLRQTAIQEAGLSYSK